MVNFSIQLLLLPVPVLGLVVTRGAKDWLIVLQKGLSKQAQAQIVQEILSEIVEDEEDGDVRP